MARIRGLLELSHGASWSDVLRISHVTSGDRRRSASLALRRIGQTPTTFSNWPQLLVGLFGSKVRRGPAELTFRTRDGQVITAPNAPGARVPPYEVFAEDCYDLVWFLGDLAGRSINALDIGAHVGSFSCLLGRVHPEATIDCFEPSADTARFLFRNIEQNGLTDRVTPHQRALAGENGWAVFDQQGAGSGHNHLSFDGVVQGSAAEVETVTFDAVVAAASGPVELVKMDCEGGEYDLVYRSSPESWVNVRRLVLEYHAVEGESWEELRSWFARVGLHVVRNVMGTPGLGVAWLSRDPLDDPAGRGERTALERMVYEGRRVAQTPRAFQNWPSLLWGLARERLGKGPETLTFLTRSGLRLTAPNRPGARLPAYEQFAEDCYRLPWFLGSLASEPMHGLDVGAHVGTFASKFAEVHPTATLTCFEPSSETAVYLRRNIEQNGLGNRVTVQEAALTGESGWALFDDHGGASVHSGLVHGGAEESGAAVKVRTLGFDEVVAESPRPITFVKLDCEGGEYEMAYRSSPASWDTVERVVLEYHDIPGQSWAVLRKWFADVGLHLVQEESIRANLGTAWLSRGQVT